MSKVSITFEDIGEHDQKSEMMRMLKADEMYGVLFSVCFNMKKGFEHEIEGNKYESQYDLLDAIFSRIHEELSDRGIDLDSLG